MDPGDIDSTDRAVQQRRPEYEPPRLTTLGTLAELTRGVNPVTSDGIGPGSFI
jgi:hypothetical protein